MTKDGGYLIVASPTDDARNESYSELPPITPEQARSAALALIGAKLNSEDPPCGLLDVLDALSIREVLNPPEAEPEEPKTTGVAEVRRDRLKEDDLYTWCPRCLIQSLNRRTQTCVQCQTVFTYVQKYDGDLRRVERINKKAKKLPPRKT